MEILTSPYFLLFARLTLGGVFLVGAVGKLIDPDGSQAALGARSWMPRNLAGPLARLLPWLEAAVGVLLLLGLGLQFVAPLAVLMLIAFTVSVLLDLRGGSKTACHCFGSFSRETVGPMTVLRNLTLIALALALALNPLPYLALDGLFRPVVEAPANGEAVVVFLLAVLAVGSVVLGGTVVSTIRGFLRAF